MTRSTGLLPVRMNLITICVISLVFSYSKATVTSPNPTTTDHGPIYESIAYLKNDVKSIIQQQRDTLNILTAILQRQDDTQRQLTQFRQEQENTQRQLTQLQRYHDGIQRQLTPFIQQHDEFQNQIETFMHQHQSQLDQQQVLENISETLSSQSDRVIKNLTKVFTYILQSTINPQQNKGDKLNAQMMQNRQSGCSFSTEDLELKQALYSVLGRTAALQSLLIRLVHGRSYNEGRVEVFHAGVESPIYNAWGKVCDENWTDNDAKVVCRQLGLPYENAEAKPSGYFGVGSSITVHLSNVECNGQEGSLWSCNRKHLCHRYSDVGVVCHFVRLVNGSNDHAGRVELWHGGQWRTVCDEDWDYNDAKVVCRELGLPYENAVAVTGGVFGRGTGKILLHGVNCTGSESKLSLCRYKELEKETCENAGVICQSPVRLTNGENEHEGIVEVWYKNEWGTVCDEDWDIKDAKVVCRQLGLSAEAIMMRESVFFGESTGQIWLKDVACSGTEENIWSCRHKIRYYSTSSGCDDKRPAAVVCHDIRLANGTTAYEGRVEVWHNGQWGTICDRDWDIDDAMVVCRQLDFSYENAVVKTGAYFGEGTGPIWLDNVNCTGQEQNVTVCGHSKWGVSDCDHSRDVGVICEAPIQLVNGIGSHEGRLEVWHNGQWGTVCDTHFGDDEKERVCMELKLPYRKSVVKTDAYFGEGTGQIWMDEIDCQGYEKSFLSCKLGGWGNVSCNHSDDVGVKCELPIRLVKGRNAHEGRVEVWHNHQWGTVCDAGWDYNNAKVVCRQLGLSYDNVEVKTGAYFGEGYGLVWLDDVDCTGTEEKLSSCDHSGWGMVNCNQSFDVGVVCQPPIRLVDGHNQYEGRVEVWSDLYQWGSVCSNTWNDTDATVVCRQLGLAYDNVESRTQVYPGRGSDQVWLDSVECSGNEERLVSCKNGRWITGMCIYDVAGVVCQAPIRLRDHPDGGKYVDVWYEGEWGIVCGYYWDDVDAKVACRQLGLPYENAKASSRSRYALSVNYIWLSYVYCKGHEEDLFSCPNSGRSTYCGEVATVLCQ